MGSKAVLLCIMVLASVLGCLTSNPVELKGGLISEYKGEKLSSINDFRENSIKGPQHVNISDYRLEVSGLVDNPKSYTYDEVLTHQAYSKVLELDCVEGWSVRLLWEGVLVRDLVNEAKAKPNANTIVFYAVDGYSTSFPLDYVMDNDILLAYKMDNVTLPAERGYPFELAAESKWGYKWIKWVSKIELTDDPSYRGFWESRGYSQDGSLSKSQFE